MLEGVRKKRKTKFPTISVSRLALCEANCKKPVYTMHKWWARRLGVVFRMLLLAEASGEQLTKAERWSRFYSSHSLPPEFTVLDPFLGGGTSLIEAAKLGATCLGYDIDPVACFVSEMELACVDPEEIQNRYEEIQSKVAKKLKRLYETNVGRNKADVIYNFWVDEIECPECSYVFDGHPTFQLATDSKRGTQTVICSNCDDPHEIGIDRKVLVCRSCSQRSNLERVPVSMGKCTCPECFSVHRLYDLYKNGYVEPRLFAKDVLKRNGERCFARATANDLEKFEQAKTKLARTEARLPIPNTLIPSQGRSDSRPLLFGYYRYRELFNDRQLYCLGTISAEIKKTKNESVRKSLALAFSHCLASNNMFCGYAFGYRRLTPLFSVHSYRKISRPVEGNVWGIDLGRGTFTNCVKAVIAGNRYMLKPYEFKYRKNGKPVRVFVNERLSGDGEKPTQVNVKIRNQSSAMMSGIKNESVDLILSDPPYFDNLPYSELADFYHVWLRELLGRNYVGYGRTHTPMEAALFAGRRLGNSCNVDIQNTYSETLSSVFGECFRVAKPTAKFVFTYHHRNSDAWAGLGAALIGSGFRLTDVFPVRSEGRSGLHSYEGSIKWDSVFLCTKRTHRKALKTPSDRQVANAIRNAASESTVWRNRINTAGLEFTRADRRSLAMSLLLLEFCDKRWNSTILHTALDNLLFELAKAKRSVRSAKKLK